jgi:S-DNA-T family DNA segregation ATPase FtsK/SpoIIIE
MAGELPLTITDDATGLGRDVLVTYQDTHSLGDLTLALGRTPPALDDGRVTLLSSLHLVAGDRLDTTGSVSRPLAQEAQLLGQFVVSVVGGQSAGASVPLAAKPMTIGRDPGCDVCIADPEASRVHASLSVTSDGVVVEDLNSANGTVIRGRPISQPTTLEPGGLFCVGNSVVTVRRVDESPASLEETPDGRLRFNRPPRATVAAESATLTFPPGLTESRRTGINIAAVVAPVVVGIGVAVLTGQPAYLLFVLASPIVALVNNWSNKRSAQRRHDEEVAKFEAKTKAVEAELAAAVQRDELIRRWLAPDPAATLVITMARSQRLWERRPEDGDFLDLRVGTVVAPAHVTVQGGSASGPPNADLVPASVPLAAAGVAGVAGPRETLDALVRAMLVNLATLHAPDELSLVIVSDVGGVEEWDWAKWLPHLRPVRGEPCRRLVGFDPVQRRRRLAELVELVELRRGQQRPSGASPPPGPAVVVVLDGIRTLRADEQVASLLRDGPAVGVYAICLAEDRAGLPAEGRASVLFATTALGSPALVIALDGDQTVDVIPDGMSFADASRAARSLAPLYSVSAGVGQRGRVPDPPVDELEILGIGLPTAAHVAATWQRATGNPRAVLGLSADGPLEFDLSRDGPHALIAGTTGAGKSELLQTLVGSLAVQHPPDALTFLLVDFKGGSAFRECERLPHTVGVISNLDGRLVERALDSIQAELRWRQERFAEAGAKDFDEYRSAVAVRPHLTAVPRLAIVVDELKELVDAYGAAVPRLSQTARLGRSLGVHLVLATQKPGSVPGLGDLRANTDLRISLRVQEVSDSQDVIGAADAAAIPKAMVGRGLARFGDGRLVLFQAGYLGAPLPTGEAPIPIEADPFSLPLLGDEPKPSADRPGPADGAVRSKLAALVGAIADAAEMTASAPPRLPWLPPLEPVITVDDPRLSPPYVSDRWAPVFPFAVADLPNEQRQDQLGFDLDRHTHVLVIGPGRSGRTTTLRTIAGAIAAISAPTDVHVYAIECRGRSLVDLERLPHCGGVINIDDTERLERLLGYLSGEIGRRDAIIAGISSLGEYRHERRAQSDTLPYVVVLVDNYEAFAERFSYEDGGRLNDLFASIVSEGPARGIHAVLTTDRRGAINKVAASIPDRLFLHPTDRDDQAMLGLPVGSVDPNMGPGRGYWHAGPVEAQVALLRRGAETEVEAIERMAEAARSRPERPGPEGGTGQTPRRVPPLPSVVHEAHVAGLRTRPSTPRPGVITPAVGGLEVEPIEVDVMANGASFVVAGPRGSGRSTALAIILQSLAGGGDGRPVCVVTPRRSPLRTYAPTLRFPGGLTVFASAETFATDIPAAIEGADGRVVLVIDDAEMLLDDPVSGRLDRIVRTAADREGMVVLAGTTNDLGRRFSGWIFDARQSRTGLLLQPTGAGDGDVFDVRLPRSVGAGAQSPPGRGLIVVRGRWVPAQVIVPAGLADIGGDPTEFR